MNCILKACLLTIPVLPMTLPASLAGATSSPEIVKAKVDQEYPSLLELYKHLHTHPELSFQEEKTSAKVAEELRAAGYEVTTRVGGYGVVGLFRNGPGRVVLIRTDMDALPVKEQTGLPYAS